MGWSSPACASPILSPRPAPLSSAILMHRQTLFTNLLFGLILCQFEAYKVAIIGGGISGSFAAKYLAEYDANHRSSNDGGEETRDCLLDEIVVYDASPPPAGFSTEKLTAPGSRTQTKVQSSADPRPPNWQGSRVSSITLYGGSVVELGASIIYEGNRLVVDMMNGDPTHLVKSKPMATGKKEGLPKTKKAPAGIGIFHGQKEWLLNTSLFARYPSWLKSILEPLYFIWRYNFDYFRLDGAVKRAVQSFDLIYDLLNDTQHEVTYFQSPMDMWEAMGLRSLAGVSFHDLLDGLGMYRDESLESQSKTGFGKTNDWWNWRKWIPGIGCMRAELVSAITLNTYNQDLNQMNGLGGLVAYVPVGGKFFSVRGGNHQLMVSALFQSKDIYESSTCQSSQQRIHRHQKQITAVIASEKSMELYAKQESLGKFDIVILAAPLQQCQIQFLVESPLGLDELVLHEMPLGGTIENRDPNDLALDKSSSTNVATNEHGKHLFAPSLPPSATEPYISVVTTVVSNATLNASHFGLEEDEPWPRSIFVSEHGKLVEGITTLTILSIEEGLVKTFSSKRLDLEKRNVIFGMDHVLEYVQIWGGEENGKHGGATPSFGGGRNSVSLPYLLYDGSEHWGKSDSREGPALYYVNAIESAVAAIEVSAIGAKSCAKLVARRLELIRPKEDITDHDEL